MRKNEVFQPKLSTFNFSLFTQLNNPENGGVAQLGEHLPCKQGVMGSNPIISTSRQCRQPKSTLHIDRPQCRARRRRMDKVEKADGSRGTRYTEN